ncbi:MAG: radical SAM protein [Candidatus Omnitrophica bacterium]|nr:radical SAM protein [Candidatus Omnitrophota bacterium]
MDKNNIININDLEAPLFIAWQINAECNLGCLHCCEEAGHSMPDKLSRDETFKVLEQIVALKIPYVAFSGGEPLLHPYIFEMCEFLRKNSIDLKIETNGEYIDEKKAERFASLNLRSVQISLDGATSVAHEKLRLGGNWNKATNACKLLKSKGVNTEIVFVPTKFNIHEIGQIIDFAYSLGVYGIYTGKIMRIGRAAQNWDILCPSDEEYKEFFTTLNEKLKQYDGKMKVYFYPYDVLEELKYRRMSPAASLLVIPNGKVKLIGPLPFVCGNLKKQTLKQVWENYKISWQKPQVQEFIDRLIKEPKLLAESNKWVELFH